MVQHIEELGIPLNFMIPLEAQEAMPTSIDELYARKWAKEIRRPLEKFVDRLVRLRLLLAGNLDMPGNESSIHCLENSPGSEFYVLLGYALERAKYCRCSSRVRWARAAMIVELVRAGGGR